MKKTMKVLAMVLLFAMLVGMVGCGGELRIGRPVSDLESENEEGEVGFEAEFEAGDYVSEPEYVYTPELENTPVPTPKDPYEALVVDKATVENLGPRGYGTSGYVIRDGKWYAISVMMGRFSPARDFGYVFNNDDDILDFYRDEYNKGYNYFSFGNVPIITLKPDDKLIMVSDYVLDYMFYKVDFVGYTVSVVDIKSPYGSSGVILYDISTGERIELPDNYEVSDKAGNVVKNLRNLNYGETYTVSWFEGTKYKEHQLVANCSFYKQPENTKEYVLKGKLNKEGYASYDYSEIPPGLYRVMGGNGADIWSVIKVGE